MGILAEYDHFQELIKVKTKRLHALEVQKARYGIDVPAHILVEIEDITSEIDSLMGEKTGLMFEFWDRLDLLYEKPIFLENDYIEPRFGCAADNSNYNLNDIVRRIYDNKGCTIIEGEMGSGKTILCGIIADELKKIDSKVIPLIINLRDRSFVDVSVKGTISSIVIRSGVCDIDDISYFLDIPKLYIIFDGLDELHLNDKMKSYSLLRGFIASTRSSTVVTTRPGMNTSFVNKQNSFQIKPLERRDILPIVQSIYGDFTDNILELVSSPLKISLITKTIRGYDAERRKLDLRLFRRLMDELIQGLFHHNSKNMSPLTMAKRFPEIERDIQLIAINNKLPNDRDRRESDMILDWGQDIGIFDRAFREPIFRNALLRDYFTARYVSEGFSTSWEEGIMRLELILQQYQFTRALYLFPDFSL